MIVIPDIHGRTFWKDSIKQSKKGEKIIFLGDYLDPYPFENISVSDAIDNFLEIIKFKEENKDRVILLLGNHDIYYYKHLTGPSRYSYEYKDTIEKIFDEYHDFFQIAYETENTLFTHAGYLPKWASNVKTLFDIEVLPNAESINKLIDKEALMMISFERGGRYGYGSCIWADVSEHGYSKSIDKYQIFGHTLQLNLADYYKTGDIKDGNPIINDNYAMLDCRHAFYYNEQTKELKCVN